jgi:hypothetical protein
MTKHKIDLVENKHIKEDEDAMKLDPRMANHIEWRRVKHNGRKEDDDEMTHFFKHLFMEFQLDRKEDDDERRQDLFLFFFLYAYHEKKIERKWHGGR